MSKNPTVLGGIFIYSPQPKDLKDWYAQHLGLEFEGSEEYGAYYISFPYQQDGKSFYTCFSIIKRDHISTSEKINYRVNLRVHNMDDRIAQLNDAQIEVKGPEVHPEGKFAWIRDPEGNDLELWEDTTHTT